jgi:hypothetical protein
MISDKVRASRKITLRNRRQLAIEFVRALKDEPCADCGVRYAYYVMQFDHCRGEKEWEMQDLIRHNSWPSLERIVAEAEKCDIVCANCHAIRTHQRYLMTTSEKESVDHGKNEISDSKTVSIEKEATA